MNTTTVAGYAVTTLADIVRLGRDASAALRRLDRIGGGTMATVRAQERHAEVLRKAHEALVAEGRKDLSGALTDEDDTAQRIAQAKARGQQRPELVSRLAAARRTLRSA